MFFLQTLSRLCVSLGNFNWLTNDHMKQQLSDAGSKFQKLLAHGTRLTKLQVRNISQNLIIAPLFVKVPRPVDSKATLFPSQAATKASRYPIQRKQANLPA